MCMSKNSWKNIVAEQPISSLELASVCAVVTLRGLWGIHRHTLRLPFTLLIIILWLTVSDLVWNTDLAFKRVKLPHGRLHFLQIQIASSRRPFDSHRSLFGCQLTTKDLIWGPLVWTVWFLYASMMSLHVFLQCNSYIKLKNIYKMQKKRKLDNNFISVNNWQCLKWSSCVFFDRNHLE